MDWSVQTVMVNLALVASIIIGLLYFYVTQYYDYWKKKGILYIEPSFPFGNIKDLILGKVHAGQCYEIFYDKFKGQKYGGVFELGKPILVLTDLDMVKQIMTKDFVYFMDRDVPPRTSSDFLANHLFTMEGKEWKDMRAKLTPTFTSGKIKLMYALIEKCSEQLKEHVEYLAEKKEAVDAKELMSRFTIDIIATCAFGLEVNTLKDSNADFFKMSQLIVNLTKTFFIKLFFKSTFPRAANFLNIAFVHPKVNDFILNLVKTTVKYREENNVNRNDFLDLLIKVKNNHSLDDMMSSKTSNSTKDGLTLKEMAAQAFIFFAAGFETAASTTSFALYEIACHPDVQERLRQEIDSVTEKHGGQITYQAIQEMVYMDQVINETLRMYVSVPFLFRKCLEPYNIPDTKIVLDKNLKVVIPIYAIHHDPDIYPEPSVFDPERFTEENIKSRHNYAFLPFGEGPRMCIGMRFGKMQVKAGLSTIIANFEISVTSDTPIPMKISPRSGFTAPIRPIKLQFVKRSS